MDEYGQIDDVRKSTWAALNTKRAGLFWWVFAIIFAVNVFLTMKFNFFFGFFLLIVWFLVSYIYEYKKILRIFMQQFAVSNGFRYQEDNLGQVLDGPLFSRGHSRKAYHFVLGKMDNYLTTFFNYEYKITQDRGKHKKTKTYNFTVCEIEFGGDVPELTIEDRNFFDVTSFVTSNQKILPTESEFEKHFKVYVPEYLNIEALEILTPDVMSYLIENADKYDFQFRGNRLYVLVPKTITKRSELIKMFEITKYVIQNIAPRLERLHSHVRTLNEASERYGG